LRARAPGQAVDAVVLDLDGVLIDGDQLRDAVRNGWPPGPGHPGSRSGAWPGPVHERSAHAAEVASERPLQADRAVPLPIGVLVLLSLAGVVVSVAGLRSAAGIVVSTVCGLIVALVDVVALYWLDVPRLPQSVASSSVALRPASVVRRRKSASSSSWSSL
jgi:hypothetical protein